MSLQNDNNKAIRALGLMGFSFPPEVMKTYRDFEQLPVQYMFDMGKAFSENYKAYQVMFESLRERAQLYTCDKCGKEEFAYDDLPDEWGWYEAKDKGYLMCVDCQNKFSDKFGYLPKVKRDI